MDEKSIETIGTAQDEGITLEDLDEDPDYFFNTIEEMDEQEENMFMDTNIFSVESGYESSICPFSPEFNSFDASDLPNYNTLKKRSREDSLGEEDSSKKMLKQCSPAVFNVPVVQEANCAGPTNCTSQSLVGNSWITVTLQSDAFQLKLFNFRAGTHCSLDIDVNIVSNSNMKRYKIMKLVEITMSFLKPLFEANSIVRLTKRKESAVVKEQFAKGFASSKRAVVSCQHVLKGVALHLIDIELRKSDPSKKTSNKFSHYSRPDRNAGDVLATSYAKKYGVDEKSYTAKDIEERMQVSLMIFDYFGYLKYCSAELKEINCTFYDSYEKMFLVKENFIKAFGKSYTLKNTVIKK